MTLNTHTPPASLCAPSQTPTRGAVEIGLSEAQSESGHLCWSPAQSKETLSKGRCQMKSQRQEPGSQRETSDSQDSGGGGRCGTTSHHSHTGVSNATGQLTGKRPPSVQPPGLPAAGSAGWPVLFAAGKSTWGNFPRRFTWSFWTAGRDLEDPDGTWARCRGRHQAGRLGLVHRHPWGSSPSSGRRGHKMGSLLPTTPSPCHHRSPGPHTDGLEAGSPVWEAASHLTSGPRLRAQSLAARP